MMLYRLVYRSRANLPEASAEAEVADLVARARAANARIGITGALLHVDGQFLQAIEGPLEAVEALFEKICSDLRHRDVQLLELAPAEERLFGAWAMEQVGRHEDVVDRLPLSAGTAATSDATLALLRAQLPRLQRPD